MGFPSVISFAQELIARSVRSGETVIDATMGNGVDTLFLAELVGPKGRVYAFDIQQSALESTRKRLSQSGTEDTPHVSLLLCDHADMQRALPRMLSDEVGGIMFNLGYLPGGEPSIITKPDNTIRALSASLAYLRVGGVLTIIVYPGHPGGSEEAVAVEQWTRNVPTGFQSLKIEFIHNVNDAPFLIAITKQKPAKE